MQLDLSRNQLCGVNRYTTDSYDPANLGSVVTHVQGTYTAEGITAIANALRVNGALTVTNFLRSQLDAESAKMLAEVAKQKGISLCGFQRDQTTAEFYMEDLKPPDAILLASDLSQAVVTGALTMANLLKNELDVESATMLAEVAKQKGISLCGIRCDQTWANFSSKELMSPDVILLASDLSQVVVTGALTTVWTSAHASLSLLRLPVLSLECVCPRPRSSISQRTLLAGIMNMNTMAMQRLSLIQKESKP